MVDAFVTGIEGLHMIGRIMQTARLDIVEM